MINQPEEFSVKLLSHQLESIELMETFEREKYISDTNLTRQTNIGILEGNRGTGKKLTVLGLISRDKMIWDLSLPYQEIKYKVSCGGLIVDKIYSRIQKIDISVIVSSYLKDWEVELKKTKLKYKKIENKYDIEKLRDIMYSSELDLIIVNSKIYNSFTEFIYGVTWKRFIFDDMTDIPSMKYISAGFYWLITNNIVNLSSKANMRRAYHFISDIFKNIDNIREFFRNVTVSHIPRIEMKINQINHEYISDEIFNFIDKDKLLLLVESKDKVPDSENQCNICMQEITEYIFDTKCYARFCSECLCKWLKVNPSCPKCRHSMSFDTLAKSGIKSDEGIYSKNKTVMNTILKGMNETKFFLIIVNLKSETDNIYTYLKNNLDSDMFKKIIFVETVTESFPFVTDIILYDSHTDIYSQIGKINNISRKDIISVHTFTSELYRK